MREPPVDDLSLIGLDERSRREVLVQPLALLQMPAADHEDEVLATPLGDALEVVVEVAHGLEVDVELDRRRLMPLVAIRGDPSWTHRRAGQVAVHVEQRLQLRPRRRPAHAHRGRHDSGVRPARESAGVGLVPLLRTNEPELGEVLGLLEDSLHGSFPRPGVALRVRAKLGDRRLRQRSPVLAFPAHPTEPVGDGIGLTVERPLHAGRVALWDGR